ncbi:hypothetical protein IE077_000525, partial [Cardiosporidium cionae]
MPSIEISAYLLRFCSHMLTSHASKENSCGWSAFLSFYQLFIERLVVLIEARHPTLSSSSPLSLAFLLMDVETLPTEPALLKSHLHRMKSQQTAIQSLVESMTLLKEGIPPLRSVINSTRIAYLAAAIQSLSLEAARDTVEAEMGMPATEDEEAPPIECSLPLEAVLEVKEEIPFLASSKPNFLLRFLEYLSRIVERIQSAALRAPPSMQLSLDTVDFFSTLSEAPE